MKSRFDNWADVRVFLAVLRTGSSLAAAKQLGLSQPTVARRIDALEHTLRLTLFERDTRGFHPTQEAKRLAVPAMALETAAATFEREAETATRPDARPVRFTAPRVNFSANLANILSDFTAEHPGATFELISSYEFLDLVAGEADVAVRITEAVDDDRLICVRLTTVTASLYASQHYADRHGLPASPADLAGHRFIVYEKTPRSMKLDGWLRERIKPAQVVSRCSEPESILAAVRAGLGIGPIPTSLARDDGTLIRCFPPPEGTSVSSWLVIGPDAYRRPEVKAFCTFFAPRFRALFPRPG